MKKLLGIMLTVAMILTFITIPTVAETTETAAFDGDYVVGDDVYASFDATKDEDLTGAFVGNAADGSQGKVVTFEANGDTYAYASKGDRYLNLPICPGFVTGKTLYIKIRTFATTDVASGDKTAYIYFANTHRLGKSMENSLYTAADENLTLTAAGPGMDNIYEISDTGAWTLYAKHVGSDGPWVKITTGQTAAHVSSNFKVQSGLGISSVKVYTKNAEAAMEAAKGAAADYSDGDYVVSSFDASKISDIDLLSSSDGSVITGTFDGETYAYTSKSSTVSNLIVPQVSPIFPGASRTEYIKLRVHAVMNDSPITTGKTVYLWEKGTKARYGVNLGENLTNLVNYPDVDAPGVDVLITVCNGKVDVYTKEVGSDCWSLDKEGVSDGTIPDYVYRDGNPGGLQLYYALALNNAKVYRKVDAATSAFNAASKNNDAAAMATALSTYATNYGIDLTKLNKVEDDNAVYAKLFNLNFATAVEVAAVFDAAIADQFGAEFDGDYVEGDKVHGGFDAANDANLAGAFVADGGTVETTTFDGDTYAYANGGAGYLNIPICPGFAEGKIMYIKFRTHAITDNADDKHAYMYFANTHRITGLLSEAEMYGAAGLTLTVDGAGIDNIYAVSDTGAWTHYARQVGSDGNWVEIRSGQSVAHSNNKTFQVRSGLGVSNVTVYTKLPADEAVILLAEDSVTVRNYESGALVLASYESADGRMVDCEVITSGITADTAITISDKLNTNGATVVKAFLLNDMSTIVPVCESEIVGLN